MEIRQDFFGVLKPQFQVAAHGLVEGDVVYYPVSFVKISAGTSATNRYYEQPDFDCNNSVCTGWLKRSTLQATTVLGYSDFFALLSYGKTEHSIEDVSKPLAVEGEGLYLNPGGEPVITSAGALIWKENKARNWILASRDFRAVDSVAWSRSQYFIFRGDVFDSYQLTLGLGQFESSRSPRGGSVVVSLSRSWGEKLSLF